MDFQEFIKNKADELVSLGWPDDMILSFIDGAEQVKNYFGWRPASETPIPNAPYISVVFCKGRNGWLPFIGYGCDISPKKTVEFINRINDAADVLNEKEATDE